MFESNLLLSVWILLGRIFRDIDGLRLFRKRLGTASCMGCGSWFDASPDGNPIELEAQQMIMCQILIPNTSARCTSPEVLPRNGWQWPSMLEAISMHSVSLCLLTYKPALAAIPLRCPIDRLSCNTLQVIKQLTRREASRTQK